MAEPSEDTPVVPGASNEQMDESDAMETRPLGEMEVEGANGEAHAANMEPGREAAESNAQGSLPGTQDLTDDAPGDQPGINPTDPTSTALSQEINESESQQAAAPVDPESQPENQHNASGQEQAESAKQEIDIHATDGSADDKYANLTAEELRAEIRKMRQENNEQLNAEERARLELEDMLLRIEKHFKAEQAARHKAEQLMQQSIETEVNLKAQLEEQQQRFKDIDTALEGDREALHQERTALETMRMDFEQELSAAQNEVTLAQDALKTAEDRVRAAEQVEKQKIITDYEQRLQSMTLEMLRMREEMQQRTVYMQREMQRYQATAMATAQAMAAAKKEVAERRKDIDLTRTKMDGLMERLYSGHEHNLTLQANLTTAQDHAGQLFTDNFMMNMMGLMGLPDPAFMAPMAPMGAPPAATGKAGAKMNPQRASGRPRAASQAPAGMVPVPPTINYSLPPIPMPKGAATSRLYQPTAATKGKRNPAKVKAREVTDRFSGSKARNDNIMAAAMANW